MTRADLQAVITPLVHQMLRCPCRDRGSACDSSDRLAQACLGWMVQHPAPDA